MLNWKKSFFKTMHLKFNKLLQFIITNNSLLQKTCTKVEVSERTVEKLLAEVGQLKQEIKRKKEQIQTSGNMKRFLISLRGFTFVW